MAKKKEQLLAFIDMYRDLAELWDIHRSPIIKNTYVHWDYTAQKKLLELWT